MNSYLSRNYFLYLKVEIYLLSFRW